LCFQHFVETQLILYCYCEAIHLTIHTLQKLISGLKSLAKVIIDFDLISNDIFERGLISVEITALLAVVKRKVRLIPPWIEALIRTESVGISNKIHVLVDRRAINTHMVCLSALFTHHAGIDHFEVIESRIFEFLHKKINLDGAHIHHFKLVDFTGVSLSVFIIPTLTRGHLFN
jgi:hypothetical protein